MGIDSGVPFGKSPRHPRLDQILSRFGYCTRRGARSFLGKGKVTLDGIPLKEPERRVDPSLLLVLGETIPYPQGLFVMFHKPVGYVCTKDEGEGATVYDLLPPSWQKRQPSPSTVGRLDKETTGLLLLTDDGGLLHRLTAPSSQLVKVYVATLDREPAEDLVARFASGILLHGEKKTCLPSKLERPGGNKAIVHLTEGRFHQVRRMFAACGYEVQSLHRSAFGPYELGELPEREWVVLPFPSCGVSENEGYSGDELDVTL